MFSSSWRGEEEEERGGGKSTVIVVGRVYWGRKPASSLALEQWEILQADGTAQGSQREMHTIHMLEDGSFSISSLEETVPYKRRGHHLVDKSFLQLENTYIVGLFLRLIFFRLGLSRVL